MIPYLNCINFVTLSNIAKDLVSILAVDNPEELANKSTRYEMLPD